VLNQAARIEHQRFVAELQGLLWFGGRIDDCRATLREQVSQLVAQVLAQLVIQVHERLIQQHQLGIFCKCSSQRGALLLATRELGGTTLQERRQAQRLGDHVHALPDHGIRLPGEPQGRGDVLENAERGIIDELLIDHGELARLNGYPRNIFAVHHYSPARRALEPRHHPHERGLPR
jgi:hypothetical protein